MQDPSILPLFLEENNLPFGDIQMENHFFVGAFTEEKLIGSGGVELLGKLGLLRSVAISTSFRHQNLGSRITQKCLQEASDRGLHSIYLLTETARSFFLKLGFKDVARNKLPQEIQSTSAFTYGCPASAVAMVYHL